ncbi:hypothetical protein RQ831_12945 [Roseomonas gilardii]|uniref:Uncharacterized protein n=1 Tax=Roseomonas gilardii TaxID=257708 RepID=A0ABU3MGL4_9PROT|nr:hypothetical protein [Roseomonas gilardii]MDT8331962.1 hypothetical protein [Roseomonas gilardii]
MRQLLYAALLAPLLSVTALAAGTAQAAPVPVSVAPEARPAGLLHPAQYYAPPPPRWHGPPPHRWRPPPPPRHWHRPPPPPPHWRRPPPPRYGYAPPPRHYWR